VTELRHSVTEQRDRTGAESVTPSRTRAPSTKGKSRCHAVTDATRDVTVERDSDSAPLERRTVTITPAQRGSS
jgi:hypothetical protein